MRRNSERGFSIVEMLVTMAIFSLVSGSVLALVSDTYRSYTNEKANSDVMWDGRAAVDLMVRELRLAGYPPVGAYAASAGLTSANSNLVATTFVTAAATQVVFEADLDGDGVVERVEYRLNGSVLERSAVPKNADGSVSAAQYQTLAANVNNGSTALFTYTTDSLSTLTAPGNTNSVRIALLLKTPAPDLRNGQYRTFRFEGVAFRQNPER